MLICGIDEAGRGPVIGPIVMAGCMLNEEDLVKLVKLGVKDSKLLTIKQREFLFEEIKKICKYKIIVTSPKEIDSALLSEDLNLNLLEAHKSAEIINELKPDTAIVDCPSNNVVNYTRYLLDLLNNKKIKLVVEHKADLNHVIVGAGSILAKVTRDREIEKIKKKINIDFGSGYPSDPKTKAFVEKYHSKYPGIFRETWSTHKTAKEIKNQKKLNEF